MLIDIADEKRCNQMEIIFGIICFAILLLNIGYLAFDHE